MKLLSLTAVVLLVGCAGVSKLEAPGTCQADAECNPGQVCFAEGCGDPGVGLVVEVAGGGQVARDFPLTTGSIALTQDFDLGASVPVSGEFQRELSTTGNPADRTFYAEPVVVRAVGQSVLIPGLNRVYEGRFEHPERGAFTFKVGDGEYAMTATPVDRTVPPVMNRVRLEASAVPPAVTFVFPSVEGARALAGQLIVKMDTKLVPPEPVRISTPYTELGLEVPTIDVQLFDAQTNQTLSQRFPLSALTGEFAITMSPEARTRSQLALVATPREPGVAIPTKRFVLQSAQLIGPLTLEYGDFGAAAEVTGLIVDSAGTPVAGAQVVMEGAVVGDGIFRSKIVQTNSMGEFRMNVLGARGDDGTFKLTVAPPRANRGAFAQRAVKVKVTKTQGMASPVATLTPSRIELDDRPIARGQVNQPGGNGPAAGVSVHAIVQTDIGSASADLRALPTEPAETVTQADGSFELPLDPGTWRIEFSPVGPSPISSRLVTMQPSLEVKTQTLPTVELSAGRTVSGTITGTLAQTGTSAPVAYSVLRFFHVNTVEGRPIAILLGSSIADDRGRYRVVLPSKTVGNAR